MSFDFREGVRRDTHWLISIAGGTGSGKTESAMQLATGLAGGKKFCVIDTEAGRALHKADDYKFDHGDLTAPFSPERYGEALAAANAKGYPVIVIDSASHEYEGDGGILDMQQAEWERLMRGDESRREATRMSSWIDPKQRHKRKFVQPLLQSPAHVILCLRAEDKIEIVKQDGKTVVRPKQSLIGANGWVPICERRLPFEMTMSFLVLQENPGVPIPIKLEGRHKSLVPLDRPLSVETGRRMAEWSAGGKPAGKASPAPSADGSGTAGDADLFADDEPDRETEQEVKEVLEIAASLGPETEEKAIEGIAAHRKRHGGKIDAGWIAKQKATLLAKLEAVTA